MTRWADCQVRAVGIAVLVVVTGIAASSAWAGAREIEAPLAGVRVAVADGDNVVWTQERMQRAVPYPMEIKGEPARTAPSSGLVSGEPGAIPGELPLSQKDLGRMIETVLEEAEAGQPLGYTYPPPYTRFYVGLASYHVYPHLTIGKLFFTQGGGSYVCSAASIGNYAIFTAGHCVHSGNGSASGWSSNILFVPAYQNGSAPYGQWTWARATVLTAWYSGGGVAFDNDFAVIVLNTLGGLKISQRVGTLGFAWNQPMPQHWFSFGYPAAAPFNGGIQWACAASHAYSDNSFPSPGPVGMGCDMTGGCSGGPWIKSLIYGGPQGGNFLNGVNSYRYTANTKELYSPYFDNRAKTIYDCGRCSTPSALSCGPC